jgi:hypothetical protein
MNIELRMYWSNISIESHIVTCDWFMRFLISINILFVCLDQRFSTSVLATYKFAVEFFLAWIITIIIIITFISIINFSIYKNYLWYNIRHDWNKGDHAQLRASERLPMIIMQAMPSSSPVVFNHCTGTRYCAVNFLRCVTKPLSIHCTT